MRPKHERTEWEAVPKRGQIHASCQSITKTHIIQKHLNATHVVSAGAVRVTVPRENVAVICMAKELGASARRAASTISTL